jgi:probable rRNA maturation factor
VIQIEVENRSGAAFHEGALHEVVLTTLDAEGVSDGDLGITLVAPDEMRALKSRHLGIDEPTDVLSFPIDGREALPEGVPRQLGDVVLCPAVVGADWRRPLVHGLLHLLGYDHGRAMERREAALVLLPAMNAGPWPASTPRQNPGSPSPRHPALAAGEGGPRLDARDPGIRRRHRKEHTR